MFYFLTWLIVALIAVCVAGAATRGHELEQDDYGFAVFMCSLWPLVLILGAVFAIIMIPFVLFAFFRGDLDADIKIATSWVKKTWNSIGD